MGTRRITSRVLVASAVVLPASALSSYASGAASSESDSESSDTIAVTAPVVSPDGTVVRRFRPRTEPDAPEVIEAIEGVLTH